MTYNVLMGTLNLTHSLAHSLTHILYHYLCRCCCCYYYYWWWWWWWCDEDAVYIGQCLPGSFSASGLEACETCPQGYYQPHYAETACIPCPSGMTTWRRGTRQFDQCRGLWLNMMSRWILSSVMGVDYGGWEVLTPYKYAGWVRVCFDPLKCHIFIQNYCWITLQVSHHHGWKTCVKNGR